MKLTIYHFTLMYFKKEYLIKFIYLFFTIYDKLILKFNEKRWNRETMYRLLFKNW